MSTPRASASLELGVIGNCSFGARSDRSARLVWCCLPRFDGDPVFCQLLDHVSDPDQGVFAIELDAPARSEQHYIPGTATFEAVLARRNHVGLLSEDTAPESGEPWGNYPQTYSLVGSINAARRLSAPWESQI